MCENVIGGHGFVYLGQLINYISDLYCWLYHLPWYHTEAEINVGLEKLSKDGSQTGLCYASRSII